MNPRARNAQSPAEESALHRLWVWLVVSLLDLYLILYHRWRVEGLEHIPKRGPLFVILNHVSFMDPFIVGTALVRGGLQPGANIFTVSKRELFAFAPLGWLFGTVGMFPIDREGMDARAIRTMLTHLNAGRMIAISPEGTRSPTGKLQAFQPVLAKMVIARRVPILPVGLIGAAESMPVGAKLPRPKQITVRIGAPFELSEYYGKFLSEEDLKAAAAEMRAHVAALLPEWMRELPPPETARRFTVRGG